MKNWDAKGVTSEVNNFNVESLIWHNLDTNVLAIYDAGGFFPGATFGLFYIFVIKNSNSYRGARLIQGAMFIVFDKCSMGYFILFQTVVRKR